MKDRTLILVRHAHREVGGDGERDNGLSEKGKEQAKAVSRYFRERYPKEKPLLLTSPKVRCIETLLPLADKLDEEAKILDLLDEQSESEKEFRKRLETFFRWWKQRAPSLVMACSHGDWIPAFTRLATRTGVDLKKGAWCEIESKDGEIRIRWILQKLE